MIGGSLFIHNGIIQDYCFEAAIRSLVHVCDEVVVCDAESTDGTLDKLNELRTSIGGFTIHSAPWKPVMYTHGRWLAETGNFTRNFLKADYHVCLQADEVIHEKDHALFRELAKTRKLGYVHRLNFWKDNWHYTPAGRVCGHYIPRIGPASLPLIGDAECLSTEGVKSVNTEITFFHYGIIRDPQALVRKAKPMQMNFFGTYDPIFDAVAERGREALSDPAFRSNIQDNELVKFNGTHPKFAHEWLKEKGFNPCQT